MDKRIKLAILVGGPSSEHDVSLKSGDRVFDGVDKEKYNPSRVFINRDAKWDVEPHEIKPQSNCVFIALHGRYGEDGTTQRILDEHKIAYTGSGALSSALGMNKFLSLRIFNDAGLNVPTSLLFHKNQWKKNPDLVLKDTRYYIQFPIVLKPNREGSSVGVYIAHNSDELKQAFHDVFQISPDVIVQNFIYGREVTCGVLDHGWSGSAFPLIPTEIIPKSSHFFDYDAKYRDGGSLEITPPTGISERTTCLVQEVAKKAHELIGASGFSRTDMIVDPFGVVWVLEINTIPGLTNESLLPKAALVSGIEFHKLLDTIIKASLFDRRYK